MSDILHVFVSSTWLDLQPERKAAETALQRMRETKLVGMEYFGSRDDTTRSVSLAEVDRSHFYIGIFGDRYGSGITEDEYRRARERGIPCRIYFKADSTITDDQREKDPLKAAKLAALKSELRRDHTVPEFTNTDNLAWRVTADLHDWLVDTSRAARADLIPVDIARIGKYAPDHLIGRENETKLLDDAWKKARHHELKRPHVLTFVALGGEGKTSLVAKWAAELAHQDWPGCDTAFAWSFYSQGTREQMAASSDLFLKEALTFFGDDADKAFAASPAGAFEKGQRLARLVGQRRSLLILDGLEPLQYAPTAPTPGELKDQGIAALLKGLAASSHGLCLVTTRYSLPDLRAFWQTTAPEVKLLRLSRDAGVHLLKTLGVTGSERRTLPLKDVDEKSERVNEFEKLVEVVKGHALTLHLLGTYLRDAHGGDIRHRDLIRLEEADAEEQGGHAFRVMDAYVQSLTDEGERGQRALALLSLLGFFDRPASADCLAALWTAPVIEGLTEPLAGMTEAQRNLALKRLEDAKLLTVIRDAANQLLSVDAHPLIREYFARRLRGPLGWSPGFSRSVGGVRTPPTEPPEGGTPTQQTPAETCLAGHRRLYEHLCATTKEGDQPTLEVLQPLYQAVAHGCLAGLQPEVLSDVWKRRIRKSDEERYSIRKLGAFASNLGAVMGFFEKTWTQISSNIVHPSDSALLFYDAAFALRGLGQSHDALEPYKIAYNMSVAKSEWKWAAILAKQLSEVNLTLGDLEQGVRFGNYSLIHVKAYSDGLSANQTSSCSGVPMQTIMRTTYADALHQSGNPVEARSEFEAAEAKQREAYPAIQFLSEVPGYRFCDLLIADWEKMAWRTHLGVATTNDSASLAARSLHRVVDRASSTLQISKDDRSLLGIAVDQLSIGRSLLCIAILSDHQFRGIIETLDSAVNGFLTSGYRDYLPRGLLTRAWLRFLEGRCIGPESAQADLDEAWEIAERGPMRLHMADVLLTRCRLFGMTNDGATMKYPWDTNPDGSARGPADDLAAAEKLINACGYGRRKEELEDAKNALRGA